MRRRHEEDSSATSTGGSDGGAPDKVRGGGARRLSRVVREALEAMDGSDRMETHGETEEQGPENAHGALDS